MQLSSTRTVHHYVRSMCNLQYVAPPKRASIGRQLASSCPENEHVISDRSRRGEGVPGAAQKAGRLLQLQAPHLRYRLPPRASHRRLPAYSAQDGTVLLGHHLHAEAASRSCLRPSSGTLAAAADLPNDRLHVLWQKHIFVQGAGVVHLLLFEATFLARSTRPSCVSSAAWDLTCTW